MYEDSLAFVHCHRVQEACQIGFGGLLPYNGDLHVAHPGCFDQFFFVDEGIIRGWQSQVYHYLKASFCNCLNLLGGRLAAGGNP